MNGMKELFNEHFNELFIDNSDDISHIRAARYENGAPAEFCFFDKLNESITGNIYAARVKKILPSRFAFLDIGTGGRDAFLHLDDYKERYISQNTPLKQGDTCLVQVTKDETQRKGAYATTQITFTNKYFALLLNGGGETGISQKITDTAERKRLKTFAAQNLPEDLGIIIRTEAQNEPEEKLISHLTPLIDEARHIQDTARYALPPALLKKQESLLVKITDKLLTRDIKKITVTNPDDLFYQYINRVYGGSPPIIEVYTADTPLFKAFDIEREVKKALDKKVWLDSGGFLIIEETEACACIDVNSGKNTKGGYEKTVGITNTEAAYEAARQIRLRNLSGLILIDFINPKTKESLYELKQAAQNAIKKDRLPIKIEFAADIGVFLFIRKKAYESLSKTIKKEDFL